MSVSPEYGVFLSDKLSVGGFVTGEYGEYDYSYYYSTVSYYGFALGATARTYLKIKNWLYYTPAVYIGITPYIAAEGQYTKSFSYWSRIDVGSFDFRFSDRFAIGVNLLSTQAAAMVNNGEFSLQNFLSIAPMLATKIYF